MRVLCVSGGTPRYKVSEKTRNDASVDVEAVLARHTVKRAIYVGPVMIVLWLAINGSDGALGAAIGVVVVAAMFLLSGQMLSVAARISLSAYHAAALFGFAFRLILLAVSMLLITRVMEIDRLAFGITTVVTYLVLISWEAVAVSKGSEKELEWIN